MIPLRVTLHSSATAITLAAARIFILLIWLVRVSIDDIRPISYLDHTLHHSFGAMKLMPSSLIELLLSAPGLLTLKCLTLLIVGLGILGIGRRGWTLGCCSVLLVIYLGLLKGFGGHVNHRELVLLYMTVALSLLPCYDALSLNPDRNRRSRQPGVYSAAMICLCLILLFQYAAVGAARLFVGTPQVFELDTMRGWILSRNLRPNPYEFDLGIYVLQLPLLLWSALPISTILELLAPVVIWSGPRVRLALLFALAAFHGSILLLMNIPFFENILLLLLCVNYTPFLQRFLSGRIA